jgi:hypothetical protein
MLQSEYSALPVSIITNSDFSSKCSNSFEFADKLKGTGVFPMKIGTSHHALHHLCAMTSQIQI